MAAKKPTKTISTPVFWLASLLFFISGGTGLAYQVIWFKRFAHVWGSSSLAFAAVGGSFLFGLGLGAYLFGRYADRATMPLRWYGVCELLIGALALVIPFEIAALVEASSGFYADIPEQPLLRFLVQFCITLVVIGPPCVLMGGTLPLLIRQLTTQDGSIDQATGWLYAINTFGAAAGCYFTGFHFLATFGLLWTNNAAATVNILIGLVSLYASSSAARRIPSAKSQAATHETQPAGRLRLLGLYLATALSGCAALTLEMTWTRQLALVLGGSTYAYTATLFVVLVGIGLGSLLFHVALRRYASQTWLLLAVVGVLLASTLAGKAMVPTLSLQVASQNVREMRGDQFWNGAICAGVSGVLEFLPSVAMGILFPLFVHLTQASAANVGAAVGRIYAWNTLGSIAGASLTSLLLFPWIGTAGSLALASGMYLVALLAVLPWQGALNLVQGLGAAAVGAAVVVAIAQPFDPLLTNMGFYLYGDPVISQGTPDWMDGVEQLFFKEGASSNVLVTRREGRVVSLRVNGKVDASDATDMVTQVGLAYVPRILKPDAREVLVIGFGSGCTPGRSLIFPETRVTCCEIEPAVYEASHFFAKANHSPEKLSRTWLEARNAELPRSERLTPEQIAAQARFSMILGDGRTAVQGSDKKYDLIISEPSNPWLAGVSNLFTSEFFRSAREHLTEGGVLAQWVQTYNFTLADYLMIVRTMRSEFKYCAVLLLSTGADTILLASDKPLMPDPQGMASLQKIVDDNPKIATDLRAWFGTSDLRYMLLEYYQVGQQQLETLVTSDPAQTINTDLHLRLEFDAPLHLFRTVESEQQALVALQKVAVGNWTRELAGALGLPSDLASIYATMGDNLMVQRTNPALASGYHQYALDRAERHFRQALKIDPKSASAERGIKRVALLKDKEMDAVERLIKLTELVPEEGAIHAELAQTYARRGQQPQAVEHFRRALELHPGLNYDDRSHGWANDLAWILSTSKDPQVRNGEEALRWSRLACELDGYDDPNLLDTLAAALAETGQFPEAVKYCEQVLARTPDGKAAEPVRARLKLYQSSQPYREN